MENAGIWIRFNETHSDIVKVVNCVILAEELDPDDPIIFILYCSHGLELLRLKNEQVLISLKWIKILLFGHFECSCFCAVVGNSKIDVQIWQIVVGLFVHDGSEISIKMLRFFKINQFVVEQVLGNCVEILNWDYTKRHARIKYKMLRFNIQFLSHVGKSNFIHSNGPIVVIAFRVGPKYILISFTFLCIIFQLVVTENERALIIWVRCQVNTELRFHSAALLCLNLLKQSWKLFLVGFRSKTNEAACRISIHMLSVVDDKPSELVILNASPIISRIIITKIILSKVAVDISQGILNFIFDPSYTKS